MPRSSSCRSWAGSTSWTSRARSAVAGALRSSAAS